MSVMDELLNSLDVEVQSFALCKIENGWALALDPIGVPIIHYVLRGTGTLRLHEGAAVNFAPHDFMLIPSGRAHRVESEGEDLKTIAASQNCVVLAEAVLGMQAGDDPDLVVVCGMIKATYGGSLGLFDRLDRPVAVHLGRTDPLRQAFEAMLAELALPTIGTRALAGALLKQCLVLLLRRLARGEREPAWLLSLVDSRLAGVVTAILEDSARQFSLKSLADQAGMSRSGFALRFSVAFGVTPMEFVKRVRLRYAARLLRTTDLPVAAVATKVGYASRTYFSRAFRAAYGKDPQSFRANKG